MNRQSKIWRIGIFLWMAGPSCAASAEVRVRLQIYSRVSPTALREAKEGDGVLATGAGRHQGFVDRMFNESRAIAGRSRVPPGPHASRPANPPDRRSHGETRRKAL